MTEFKALFSPFTLNGLELQNRIVMAPMTRSHSPDQTPTDEVAAYYRRRAEGGVGLIITEGVTLEGLASTFDHRIPKLAGEAPLAGWRKVVDEVRAAGGKIFPQLWHVGSVRRADKTPAPDVPSESPSGISSPGNKFGEGVTEEQAADIVHQFAKAAAAAMEVGFDGIELHGAHGYLIDQFFWAGTNERDDKYGGDMVGRTRFAVEVIKAVRAEIGDDVPLMLRWSQWKQQEYTARLAETPEDLAKFLEPLTAAGLDAYHCSQRRYWEPEFEGSDLNLAGWVKKLTGLPTVTVGSIGLEVDFLQTITGAVAESGKRKGDIADVDRRIAEGEFDLAAVGRALLGNPDWANKVKAGDLEGLVDYEKRHQEVLV